ncbi:MAG: TolC family protein [Deltaproteobacteria bacterium]|jgi:outer membrane protein TolC|nr:TolC family protein [Deltaproteobacteria bacterium]
MSKITRLFPLKIFSLLAPFALLAVLAGGCAEPARHVIAKPYLAEPPSPETVFGEATLGEKASEDAIKSIEAPPLPHGGALSLDECLTIAQKVSPSVDSAQQGQYAAMWSQWQSAAAFLPTGSLSYGVNYHDAALTPTSGRDQYTVQLGISQPLYTGGARIASYHLARLGVTQADIQTTQAREDLLLQVKQVYFAILASEKALEVAKNSVVNLQSHHSQAVNNKEAGKGTDNDVLQAEVQLAQAQQEVATQESNLLVNKTRLNMLLRQPYENKISVRDNLLYAVFPLTLEKCLELGLANNPELLLGRTQVEAGAKNVDLAKSGYFPTVTLNYSSSSTGNTPKAHGGWSADSTSWNVALLANLNFWEWGKTKADVEKSKVQLNQAVNNLTLLEDNAKLEITSNYQSLLTAGKNINTSATAVRAAAEDLRIARELIAQGKVTMTDVLDSLTRYSQAQYGYYSSLYNYNLAWAGMERTLGERVESASAGTR